MHSLNCIRLSCNDIKFCHILSFNILCIPPNDFNVTRYFLRNFYMLWTFDILVIRSEKGLSLSEEIAKDKKQKAWQVFIVDNKCSCLL